MSDCKPEGRAVWICRTLGSMLGAGLLAIPGVFAGGILGKGLSGDGCLGAFVGVAMATALGINVGGAAGVALGALVFGGSRALGSRSPRIEGEV